MKLSIFQLHGTLPLENLACCTGRKFDEYDQCDKSFFSLELERVGYEGSKHVRDSVQLVENAVLERDQVNILTEFAMTNTGHHEDRDRWIVW